MVHTEGNSDVIYVIFLAVTNQNVKKRLILEAKYKAAMISVLDY